MFHFLIRKLKGIKVMILSSNLSDKELKKSLSPYFFSRLLERNSLSKKCQFFVRFKKQKELLFGIKTTFQNSIETVIKVADNYCDHRFAFLGSEPFEFGEEIDWHLDFKSGHRWNSKFPSFFLRYDEYEKKYDVKVPWELSRFQHLPTLGKAYWYTGNEKYAEEYVRQISSWIMKNPVGKGVNWICTMDVAIRAINWIWGYFFFEDYPNLSVEFKKNFLKSILVHGRHIFHNLEVSYPRSNHYLSDLVGLIFIGITFPEFRESQKWVNFATSEFEKEIKKQVYMDGADFEASISYHRLILEISIAILLLCKINGVLLSQDTVDRIEKMLEFTMHYTKPSGCSPQIGDNDSGRLYILSEETRVNINDHRYLLAIGGVLYKRADFVRASGKFWEEAYWHLGLEGIKAYQNLEKESQSQPNLISTAFRDTGIYIMRDKDFYFVIDAGGNGQDGNGGHAHNDIFSFELEAYGNEFLIDRGTYLYTGNYKMRNEFRSTRSHNTVEIDGEEINPFEEKSLFKMKDIAKPKVLEWYVLPDRDIFIGEHHGYTRLRDPVVHRRMVYFNKTIPFWLVQDQIFCKENHVISVRFYTPLFYENFFTENNLYKLILGSKGFLLIYPLNSTQCSAIIQPITFSPSYGVLKNGFLCCYTYYIRGDTELQFLLLPSLTKEKILKILQHLLPQFKGIFEFGDLKKTCVV